MNEPRFTRGPGGREMEVWVYGLATLVFAAGVARVEAPGEWYSLALWAFGSALLLFGPRGTYFYPVRCSCPNCERADT